MPTPHTPYEDPDERFDDRIVEIMAQMPRSVFGDAIGQYAYPDDHEQQELLDRGLRIGVAETLAAVLLADGFQRRQVEYFINHELREAIMNMIADADAPFGVRMFHNVKEKP